jgi:hypothetical protein
LDNSTVLVTGTGAAAKAVPEMVPFEQLFHFRFVAHEVGDANRSGRVERPFHHVETNFYPGREFADLSDLNRQLEAWCGRYNSTFNKHYQFTPDEIGAAEAPYLQALPRWIPEPTEVHPRKVDVEGYIQLHSNRYSVPEEEIGQQVEVHQSWERVKIYLGSRLLGDHPRLEGRNQRSTLPEHRRQRDRKPAEPSPEERQLQGSPELSEFCERLRKKYGGQGLKGIRTLYRMWRDYPDSALNPALRKALDHNLLDLERVESMVIQQVRSDYFKLEVNDG